MGYRWKDVFNVCGFTIMLAGCSIVMSIGVFVPLFTVYMEFNTKMVEDLVIDHHDCLDDKGTYQFFLWGSSDKPTSSKIIDEERKLSSSVFMYWVYDVQNPKEIIEAGDKPSLQETGPFGYRQYTMKYDVEFDIFSDLVSYKSWSYYVPITDFYNCRVHNSQLGLVQDQAKECIEDTTVVTVLNKQFVQYMQEHTVSGLMGQVGKYLFQEVRDIFTHPHGAFQQALKIWNLPSILKDVFYVQSRQKISLALNDVVNHRNNYFPLYVGEHDARDANLNVYATLPGTHVPFYRFSTPQDRFNHEEALSKSIPLDGNHMSVTAYIKQPKDKGGAIMGYTLGNHTDDCCWCFFSMGAPSDNDFQFHYQGIDGSQRVVKSSKWNFVDNNEWWHVGLVVEEVELEGLRTQRVTFFVDGEKYGKYRYLTVPVGNCTELGSTKNVLKVGSRTLDMKDGGRGRDYFRGYLKDVRLFPKSISAAEVLSVGKYPYNVESFRSTDRVFCGTDQNSYDKVSCPLGAGEFIQKAGRLFSPPVIFTDTEDLSDAQKEHLRTATPTAEVALSMVQATNLLSVNKHGSLLNMTGFKIYLDASDHLLELRSGVWYVSMSKNPNAAVNKIAYDTLGTIFCGWNGQFLSEFPPPDDTPEVKQNSPVLEPWGGRGGKLYNISRRCQAQVDGILDYLFNEDNGWVNEKAGKTKAIVDWIKKPRGVLSCERRRTVYCNWTLTPYVDFMGYTTLPAFTYVDDPEVAPKLPTRENMDMNISLEVARALIDPQKSDVDLGLERKLSVSLLNSETFPKVWGLAHYYCDARRNSRDMTCAGMSRAVEMVKDILGLAFATLDGTSQTDYANNFWAQFKYEFQVCSVATYAFKNWVHNNEWLHGALAAHVQKLFPEIWSDESVNGQLQGNKLAHVGYLQWATSYYTRRTFGEKIYSLSDMPLTGDVPFAFPELHPRVRWLSLDKQSAREPFELGAVLLRNNYEQMVELRNSTNGIGLTVFQCQVLLDALATNRWPKHRRFLPTGESALIALIMATIEPSKLLVGDHVIGAEPTLTKLPLPPGGVEFDYVPAVENAEGIDDQKVNETYGRTKGYRAVLASLLNQSYQINSFAPTPYPTLNPAATESSRAPTMARRQQRGTIIAYMTQVFVMKGFFLRRRMWCNNVDNCDYQKGGLFIRMTAREALFGGYTDPFFSWLSAREAEEAGYRFRCKEFMPTQTKWNCGVELDNDCSDGYQLVTAEVQDVITRADELSMIRSGYFQLKFRHSISQPIRFDSTAKEMKVALESMPSIGRVLVTRTETPRQALSASLSQTRTGDEGYTWSVTFFTEKGDVPMIEPHRWNFNANFTGLGDRWTEDVGGQVWVREMIKGRHPGKQFDPVLFYSPDTAKENREWFRRTITLPNLNYTRKYDHPTSMDEGDQAQPAYQVGYGVEQVGDHMTATIAAAARARSHHDGNSNNGDAISPVVQIANPAFVDRTFWFQRRLTGLLWPDEHIHTELQCARAGPQLTNVAYDWSRRFASCWHTLETGRLDLHWLTNVYRHFGNRSVMWWPGLPYETHEREHVCGGRRGCMADTTRRFGGGLALDPNTTGHAEGLLHGHTAEMTPFPRKGVAGEDMDVFENDVEWDRRTTPRHPVTDYGNGVEVMGRNSKSQHMPWQWTGFLHASGGMDNIVVFDHDMLLPLHMDKVRTDLDDANRNQAPFEYDKSMEDMLTENMTSPVRIIINRYCITPDSWGRTLNQTAHPYGQFVGMINMRPVTHSDMYISSPNMMYNKMWGGEEYKQVAGLYDSEAVHQSCIDIEPVTGTSIRYFIRRMFSFHIGPNVLFPMLKYDMHFPIFYRQESQVIQPVQAQKLQEGLLSDLTKAAELSQMGAIVGFSTVFWGMLIIYCTLGRGLRPLAAGRKQRQIYADARKSAEKSD